MSKRVSVEDRITEFVETGDRAQVSAVLKMAQALFKRREAQEATTVVAEPVKRGRKKGSKNKAKATDQTSSQSLADALASRGQGLGV